MSSNNNSPSAAFPPGFIWGAATSSYQIEGATSVDGKGGSVWDTFSHREGTIRHGDQGDIACDHYHRFREDVKLMKQIGLKAYRFSISWPRVLPAGVGALNEAGLAFYDSLVDELLDAGIEPWVTLFHWDFPQALFDRGGWLNPESVEWFADYTRVVVARLSDRVQNWITLNEPQCFLHFGHGDGTNAPGLQLSLEEQLTATHHVLLAHGRSVQVIRELAKTAPNIGFAPVGIIKSPCNDDPKHVEVARRATMDIVQPTLWNNTWFNDPVLLGRYPEEGLQAFGSAVPDFSDTDMKTISTPIDFLGLNIYTSTPVQATGSGGYEEVPLPPGAARSSFDWPVVEESIYWGVLFYAERYKIPIVITENGMSNVDWLARDGRVHDPQRIDYTFRHLRYLQQAIDEGVDVQGYFHWSLMDNFEWAEGYGRRFGLVYIDFTTQQRVLKDSASWYREVINTNGRSLFNTESACSDVTKCSPVSDVNKRVNSL